MRYGLRGIVMTAALAAALAPAAVTRAWAETVRIEVAGEAPASAADARTRALDAAFADAVSRALEQMVDADTLRRHRDAITDVTVRRARRFIRSYRVLSEDAAGERVRVRISALVDVGGLREALAGAGVEVAAAPAPPEAAGAGRSAVLLLRAHVAGAVLTSFTGAGEISGEHGGEHAGEHPGDGGVAGRELARQLAGQGMALRQVAPGSVISAVSAGLPVDDQTAARVAQEAGAEGALVASVEVAPAERIRGTGLHGAAGRGILRVLDATTGELVAAADVSAGGFADTPGVALDLAAAELGRALAAAVAEPVAAHWQPSVAEDGALLVAIHGHQGWQHVDRIIEHLSRSSGIQRVWPCRVGAGGVVLAVDADADGARARRRVAALLRQLSLPDAGIAIDQAGDGLALTLEAREEAAP